MPVFQRTRPPIATGRNQAAIQSEAFTRHYNDFFDPIYWYCRSRLGDAAAAEDAASTVLTRALAAGPRYDDPSLRSWLFGIAHNVLANWFRAARPVAPLESAFDVPDAGPSPDDTVVAEEERDRLLSALRLLPEDQRRVVELRMAGLSGPEIAQTLGRSHGAVKMLQLRAFARLRELLADDAGNEETDRHG
jgi:RNA polymerase sigma-70 factor (ECF subfamily)